MTVLVLPRLVDAATLAKAIERPGLVIVDATVELIRPEGGGPYRAVAQRTSFAEGHIPGAVFADLVSVFADSTSPRWFGIPSGDAFASAAGRLGITDGAHVVVYSQGKTMWATRLWWLLRYFGFDDVSVLDGGLRSWRDAGLPVTAAPSRMVEAVFTPRERPELLATRADVERIVLEGGLCLVNALSAEAFRGEGVTSYSRPGRIPGSRSAPADSIVDPLTQRFAPRPELSRELAAYLSVTQDVVAYCGGGISATVLVFALAELGRDDVRLYDGSLAEWTADPALPVIVG